MMARGASRRRRGTASVPCPKCRSPSRVLRTTRQHRDVVRERECRARACRRRFHTVETRA